MSDDTRMTPLLVVDDDRAIRKLLERIAKRAGFDVDTACDGAEALEMLKRKDYAVAIVDLMMPRVSGYELLQLISTLDPRPAVIVATALTNGDVASLDDSMVRRVIRKPFDITAVAAALVETARQVADQRAAAAAASGAPAPPTIPLGPEPPSTPVTDEPAVAPQIEPKPKVDDAKS